VVANTKGVLRPSKAVGHFGIHTVRLSGEGIDSGAVNMASHDDTLPVLTGVFCHSHKNRLFFAATDGYRLAERDLGAVPHEISAIIPATTMQDVVRVMSDDIKEIEVLFDEN
jgi:DNA polymerase III sliding clamp (beta) subunit (PCNA family)